MFCTATDGEPPTGFERKHEIDFTDEDRLPEANTCAFKLRLSRRHAEYNTFKEKMDIAILNTYGFGLI